jgi:fumarylacetoacetate (FAA) hydrolase
VQVQPGEVIGSGTVGTGCLLELNGSKITHDLWLNEGDQVVMEVEGLGRLENAVAKAPGIDLPPALVAMGPRWS